MAVGRSVLIAAALAADEGGRGAPRRTRDRIAGAGAGPLRRSDPVCDESASLGWWISSTRLPPRGADREHGEARRVAPGPGGPSRRLESWGWETAVGKGGFRPNSLAISQWFSTSPRKPELCGREWLRGSRHCSARCRQLLSSVSCSGVAHAGRKCCRRSDGWCGWGRRADGTRRRPGGAAARGIGPRPPPGRERHAVRPASALAHPSAPPGTPPAARVAPDTGARHGQRPAPSRRLRRRRGGPRRPTCRVA